MSDYLSKLEIPIYIQPGFPKTATTTIEHMFSNHDEILSIQGGDELEKELFNIRGVNYNKSKVEGLLKKIILSQNIKNKKCIVWVVERMVMEPYLLFEMTERVNTLFPNCVLIFTLRNQNDLINSLYFGRAFQLSGISPSRIIPVPKKYEEMDISFKDWLEFSNNDFYFSYLFMLDFNVIISMYEKAFGKDRIHILLFEELIENKENFFLKVSKILNISYQQMIELYPGKVNPSLSKNELRLQSLRKKIIPLFSKRESLLKKLIPYYLKKSIKNLISDDKKYHNIENLISDELIDSFRKGNQSLNKKYNLNLEKYNYYL